MPMLLAATAHNFAFKHHESYDPASNDWDRVSAVQTGRSEPSAGLLGNMIVAAGGYTTGGDTGVTRSYNNKQHLDFVGTGTCARK